MIARDEAQLVKARNDLLDVMFRPGPGVHIRPPLFAEKALRLVLLRRRWHPSSLVRVSNKINQRLERAVETGNRKVSAHQARLSFYRQEIASARLVQGAIAASRAAYSVELHEKQQAGQEAIDRFNAVLALPGHEHDATALELVAHQLSHIDFEGNSCDKRSHRNQERTWGPSRFTKAQSCSRTNQPELGATAISDGTWRCQRPIGGCFVFTHSVRPPQRSRSSGN